MKTLRFVPIIFLVFTLAFILVWNQVDSNTKHPHISSTTIVFKPGSESMSSTPGKVTKTISCGMSRPHRVRPSCSSSEPETDTGNHPISETWNPSNRKVEIIAQASGYGYGEAKPSVITGKATLSNGTDVPIYNFGGSVRKIGTWTMTGNHADVTPIEWSVDHAAYFFSPEDAPPGTHNWTGSGKIEIWGVDWEGTGTIWISQSVGVNYGLDPSMTYSVEQGESSSISDDISGNASDRLLNDKTGTWTVAHENKCSICSNIINDAHEHHFICKGENCGLHIPCSVKPDGHKLCEGCNKRECEAGYDNLTHKKASCTYDYANQLGGCGNDYWECASDANSHKTATHTGVCNQKYRPCKPGNHTQTTCGATSQGSGQGTACTNTPYWNCLPHTHQFGSGSGSGSGQQGSGGNTCSTCATISGTCSECTDALEAGNGNGNGGGNGGTPVSNGGCDTSCINPNCNSSTAHTTYTLCQTYKNYLEFCARGMELTPLRGSLHEMPGLGPLQRSRSAPGPLFRDTSRGW